MRLFYLILATLASSGLGQEMPTPAPTSSPIRHVPIRFVPPPAEGTISLGIYDAAGKLVRILHREDALSEFTAGHDALETSWDGNDDEGVPLPSGKYRAGGYLVGSLKVEGVDNFFNDWVTDENSPHLVRILRIAMREGRLELRATNSSQKEVAYLYDPAAGKLAIEDAAPAAPTPSEVTALVNSGVVNAPVDCAVGKGNTIWSISRLGNETNEVEVAQWSKTNDAAHYAVLRKLAIPPNEPQPISIAAATTEERIFLLEQAADLQRVRSLTLIATKPNLADREQSISDWKIDFEKKITPHRDFALVDGKPVIVANAPPASPAKVTQNLRPNPLQRDHPDKIQVAIGIDSDGSYLETADGLPLRTISETRNLSRALIARQAENAVDVFQDDVAVVEQFRITHLEEMIAFDCGAFDLK